MNIRYIKHENIDRKKWDSCVHYAINLSMAILMLIRGISIMFVSSGTVS